MGTESSGLLRAGDTLDKLIVRERLGHGSSAVVYRAEHAQIGNAVAIKVVHGDGLDGQSAARFDREIRICGRLRSAHVPHVHDVGRLPDGSPYLVMELLEGESLEARLEREGALPIATAVEITRQLLTALEAAHHAGAIHRDVKPENLFLHQSAGDEAPVVKLMDFGIGKPLDPVNAITQEGIILGTPHYMAPEQTVAGEVDERTDVYAAAAVLYEMLTGRTPFDGKSIAAITAAVLHDPFPSPSQARPDCPQALSAVVLRAASRDRADRYAAARQMRDALERVATEQGLPTGPAAFLDPESRVQRSDPPPAPGVERNDPATDDTAPLLLNRPKPRLPRMEVGDGLAVPATRTWLALAAAAALLVVVAALAVFLP